MALPDLTGQNIETTYQRVVQTDGVNYYDGTGSLLNIGENINTGSFLTTSSFNSFTSSYNTGSFTGSFTGSLFGTSSWATNAQSASYIIATGTPNATTFLRGDNTWDKGFRWFDYVVGKLSSIDITVSGSVIQELSYNGTNEKRYRFISNPYSSSLDIIYTTFSSGSLSNPVAYKLITL